MKDKMDIDYNTKKKNIIFHLNENNTIKNYLSLKELNIYIYYNDNIEITLENCLKLKKINIFNLTTLKLHIKIINCPLITNLNQIQTTNDIILDITNFNYEQFFCNRNINNLGYCGNIILQKDTNIVNAQRHSLSNRYIFAGEKNKIFKILMEKGSYIDTLYIDDDFIINGEGTINILKKQENISNKTNLYFYKDKTNFDNIFIKKYIGKIFTNLKKCHFVETDYMDKDTEVICDICNINLKDKDKNKPIMMENIKTKILIIKEQHLNRIKFNNIQCDNLLILSSQNNENLSITNITYNNLYTGSQIKDFIKTDEFLNIDYEKYAFDLLKDNILVYELNNIDLDDII